MSRVQLYDTIGATYTATRQTDPAIAARIWAALGDARTVLNVGAGTGSYEPADRQVLAVEPSALMRSQQLPDAAPCVAGAAESLPFDDQSFDAAMAVCTVHHWRDPVAGLREMQRVELLSNAATVEPEAVWHDLAHLLGLLRAVERLAMPWWTHVGTESAPIARRRDPSSSSR